MPCLAHCNTSVWVNYRVWGKKTGVKASLRKSNSRESRVQFSTFSSVWHFSCWKHCTLICTDSTVCGRSCCKNPMKQPIVGCSSVLGTLRGYKRYRDVPALLIFRSLWYWCIPLHVLCLWPIFDEFHICFSSSLTTRKQSCLLSSQLLLILMQLARNDCFLG